MRRITALTVLLFLFLPDAVLLAQSLTAATEATGLQPGDLIRIQVWREEDLSGEFLVDTDGIVVLPLIGERRVTDTSLNELRRSLVEDYRAHLRNPSISVTPLRRVNVLGEVRNPGLYPVDPTVSLAGVVALAGGTTETGDLNRLRIVRGGEVVRTRVGVGETLYTLDVRSGDQVIVDRRSWLERNSGLFLSTALSVVGGIVTALVLLEARS